MCYLQYLEARAFHFAWFALYLHHLEAVQPSTWHGICNMLELEFAKLHDVFAMLEPELLKASISQQQ